ncbi:hypothetical protein IAR55_001680 [Kwoniella newhampshirensis]|uniref:Palmitoyltransferase n=1 Tax=Kwoniella newhampshirensis TaxID=1651941 RepID=A0AAW0Z2T9_9TREE
MQGQGTSLTEISKHIDRRPSGLALPTRSASVKLINNADEAGVQVSERQSLQRRESLEGTMSFYGVRSTSPPSGSASQQTSSSSRPTDKTRSRVRSTSSRPGTADSAVPTSPSPSAVPLPTPRGFLSPKKPASAIRLEKKERAKPSTVKDRTSKATEPVSGPAHTGHISDHRSQESIQPKSLDEAIDIGSDGNGEVGSRAGEEHMKEAKFSAWSRTSRHSITNIPTPPQTHLSHLSSDDLVNRTRSRELEKSHGNGNGSGSGDKDRKSTSEKRRSQLSHKQYGRRRKYETFENPLTTFFLSGKMMTGGDTVWSMLFVVVVLLGVSGVWLGTTGAWLWRHGREYGLAKGGGVAVTIIFVYLFGVTTSSLIASAFRDPGIIPRKLDLDPPSFLANDWWEAHPRELTVKSGRMMVKYCETCQSYRPPRSSHCRLCGNCVDGIDHHCSYLHTCVGKRNYFSFLVLLISAAISDIYIVIFSAVHFSLLCHHDHVSFGKALQNSPGAAVSFLLGIFLIGPVLFLLSYHIRLLVHNLTTVEQIRSSASGRSFLSRTRPDNPFASESTFANIILASVGRPQFPSWIDASGWVGEDRREVNPALKDPKWAREGV